VATFRENALAHIPAK